MSGFPLLPSRASFGPTFVDKSPVNDNRKEVGAGYFNLASWQLAGCGICVPRAWALLDAAGALVSSGEAWDPAGAVVPAASRPSTGVYELEYAATATDENGVAQPIVLVAGTATAQGATPNLACVVEIFNSGRSARIRVTTANTGAAANAGLLVELR